jgi:hypothetical protein
LERGVDREKSRVDRIAQKDGNTGSPWKRVHDELASKTEERDFQRRRKSPHPMAPNATERPPSF